MRKYDMLHMRDVVGVAKGITNVQISHGNMNIMSTYDDEARAGKHWCFMCKLTMKIINCVD